VKVYVAGVKDVSLIDYPRHPCIVIWFQGCNFRCPYCYNYELWNMKDENLLDIEEIIGRIKDARGFIDACKVTGGEPSIQSEALIKIGEECRKMKLKFGIDTNGTNSEIIQKLIDDELINHIAIDLKAPLNTHDYTRITGIEINSKILEEIKKTIKIAFESSLENVEIRIPIVRGLNDDPNKMLEFKRNLMELGYMDAINKGREVSLEILEVIHEVAASSELRSKRNLTVEEITYLSEMIGLPKMYIRHRALSLRTSLNDAKSAIKKFKF